MKRICLAALLLLGACAAPQPVFDMRSSDLPEKFGHTLRDFTVAKMECEYLTKEFAKTIEFGNFGGWDTKRAFVRCMEERGWTVINSDVYKK